MRKILIFIILFSFCIGSQLVASPATDLLKIIDFSTSMKTLDVILERGQIDSFAKEMYLILDGTVASRELLSKDGEPFLGEIELVQGEWSGLEKVKIYRCIVIFSGDQFSGLIPARRARRRSENEIKLNSHVLLIGKLQGTRTLTDGSTVPVIEGFLIREML